MEKLTLNQTHVQCLFTGSNLWFLCLCLIYVNLLFFFPLYTYRFHAGHHLELELLRSHEEICSWDEYELWERLLCQLLYRPKTRYLPPSSPCSAADSFLPRPVSLWHAELLWEPHGCVGNKWPVIFERSVFISVQKQLSSCWTMPEMLLTFLFYWVSSCFLLLRQQHLAAGRI